MLTFCIFACWGSAPIPLNLVSLGATHRLWRRSCISFFYRLKLNCGCCFTIVKRRMLDMFSKEELKIDSNYFDIIELSSFCVTLRSKNTGHYWHIENADGNNYRSCKIYHRHNTSDSYHLHGHAATFSGCISAIKEHDRFQLSGRKGKKKK